MQIGKAATNFRYQKQHSLRAFSRVNHFPTEPAYPSMQVPFPGPETIRIRESISKSACTLTNDFPIDIEASVGNYLADCDGNISEAAVFQEQHARLTLLQASEHGRCEGVYMALSF